MLSNEEKTRRIPWTQLFAEAGLVVLSVLLALALNSWHQDNINNDVAEQALRNLKREIIENKAQLDKAFPYHKNFLDSLKGKNPPTSIKGIFASVQNNAWDAAQAMGAIPYMDYSIVSMASGIQETQRQYQSTLETVNAIIILATFGAGGENFSAQRISTGLKSIVNELVYYEKKLNDQYDAALKVIGV